MSALSAQLEKEFGAGFHAGEIFSAHDAVCAKLFLTPSELSLHIAATIGLEPFQRQIIYLQDEPLKRDFYAEMCAYRAMEHAHAAAKRLCGLLLSAQHCRRKPDKLIRQGIGGACERKTDSRPISCSAILTCWIFSSLKDTYGEKTVEDRHFARNGSRSFWNLARAFAFRRTAEADAD